MSDSSRTGQTGLQVRLHHQPALDGQGFTLDVDLSLPASGMTALFGPSGAGKTTVLRALAGLAAGHPARRARTGQRASINRVVVNGNIWQDDVQGIFVPTHLRALGYVFQEASLLAHLSVQDNLCFGQKRVPLAQQKVSLEQAVELLGIGGLMDRAPHTLSGGERQRVAIARALATSPRLLLMDEPLAALDAKRKAEVMPYLESLHRQLDIPVVYVSHAIDEVARLADHVVLLDAGRVVASGPTSQVMTRLDTPVAQGDLAGALINAQVVSHEPQFHLTQVRFAGGLLNLGLQDVPIGAPLRIRVQARDVSLTLQHQTGTSIQNIVPVVVRAITPDGPGQTVVQIDAAGTLLLARVTAKSALVLGLQPGLALFAQFKGVAVIR